MPQGRRHRLNVLLMAIRWSISCGEGLNWSRSGCEPMVCPSPRDRRVRTTSKQPISARIPAQWATPWPYKHEVQLKGCRECGGYSLGSIWSQLLSLWTILVLQTHRSPGNKKPAPESRRSTQKSSQLVAIPSDRRVPQTRSTEVGRNWHFSLGWLSSRRTFACIADSLQWN